MVKLPPAEVDSIYKNAACTIIAVSGRNGDYGLSGVLRIYSGQLSVTIGKDAFIQTMPDA